MIAFRLLLLFMLVSRASAFDAQRAYDLANELGSDRFEGRRSGHAGGTRAEDFIADYCARIGLTPAGRSGFFQEVPMLVTEEQAVALSISGSELGKISFVQGLDFTLNTHSGSGVFTREIVVVGHGIVSPDKGRDDFGDLNVRDKVVVIVRGEPKSAYSFDDENTRSHTLKNAQDRGAAAVFWYSEPIPHNGAAIPQRLFKPDLPLYYIGDRVMQVILEGTGYSLRTYQDAIKKTPLPLITGKQANVSVRVRQNSAKAGRNVIGAVYGSDAVLRNEIIVVGAHLDHCGKNANGVIYNGAGDNASGSALIAELASTIVNGPPLKRSVLFVWFTGEEDGLIGSTYFAESPTVPFGNIVAMLNFDMVGQGDGGASIVGLELLGTVGKWYADSLEHSDKPPRLRTASGNSSSDYAPFVENGAPGISFYSSGSHPFYHHFTDDGKWLNVESFHAVGTQAEALIRFLASQGGTLASRSDTARVLARHATTIDVDGFFVDRTGTVRRSEVTQVAWLSHDTRTPLQELVESCAHLHAYCKAHEIVCSDLQTAIASRRNLKQSIAIAIPEMGLTFRTVSDLIALTKMGLSLVNLTPGESGPKNRLSDEQFELLKDAGVYALIPLDFNTATRVKRWETHSIVTSTLAQFAQSPENLREPLLTSDALVLLDIDSAPTEEQLETIRSGRQRFVHLNFGESYDDLREGDQRAAIRRLLSAGYSHDDILNLTGRNLRRFLEQ